MRLQRLIERSVYYAVLDCLRIDVTDEILTSSDYITYKSKYKNWSTESDVIIKKNDVIISSGFTLNYRDGIVKFDTANTENDIIKITYKPCKYKVIDAYPKKQEIENGDLPIISVEHEELTEEPYEIGKSSSQKMIMWFYIDVFAERPGQRSDIIDIIKTKFDEDIPVIDYNLGFPVNYDGTKNSNFNSYTQRIGFLQKDSINISTSRSLEFGNVEQYVATASVLLTYYR